MTKNKNTFFLDPKTNLINTRTIIDVYNILLESNFIFKNSNGNRINLIISKYASAGIYINIITFKFTDEIIFN